MKITQLILVITLCLFSVLKTYAGSEVNSPEMKLVSKEEFKKTYMKFGNSNNGWTKEYWDKHFESGNSRELKFKLKPPNSPQHDRMHIVTDYGANELRMFFLTIEQEEALYDR